MIIGCYRPASWQDRITDLMAIPANMIMGLARNPSGSAKISMSAPTYVADLTLQEIRDEADQSLPGSKISRRLFWRYSLLYRRP